LVWVLLLFVPGQIHAQNLIAATAPLPIPAAALGRALGLASSDSSLLLLRAIRLMYGGQDAQSRRIRDAVNGLSAMASDPAAEVVPLPLSVVAWQTQILDKPASPERLVTAILAERRTALMYYGLSAMDDETLRWLAADREVLKYLKKHPGVFASFGRSIHIRSGRVSVPGGPEAEPLWKSIAGAGPEAPAAFVRRIITGDGRLAFLYDSVAHLDPARQRFALGLQARPGSREARLRALLDSVTVAAPEWRIDEHPFSRPPIDAAILLSTVRVTARGAGGAPNARRIWERVFRGDELTDVPFETVSESEVRSVSEYLTVDAGWLAARILRVPYAIGRRRLDAFLFGQRVFGDRGVAEAAAVATTLRGYLAYPALMLAMERGGIQNPATFAKAAGHAARLSAVGTLSMRQTSIAEFQAAVALIERAYLARQLDASHAEALLASLSSLDTASKTGYEAGFSRWLRDELGGALIRRSTLEETILAAIAGAGTSTGALPVVEWEGRAYRADPGSAELRRLQLVRHVQGGQTLDAAVAAAAAAPSREVAADVGSPLAATLTSIVYALHLGDPESVAVTSGNVALRHDFGLVASATGSSSAVSWRLPIEYFDGKVAWRIRGSILGLESALGRLTLRRLDPTAMPGEPKLGPQDRQTVMLAAALLNPFQVTDSGRDEIAAALARGRARVAALTADPTDVEDLARAAGLSEWRQQALRWSLAQGREVLPQFSLLELFWAGSPASDAERDLDHWGAAALPLTGCLCLEMPHPAAWEDFGGRSMAVLATRGADIALQIADTLAALELPASLAPAIGAFATQDVIEHAQLAYQDDWQEFGRAARELPRERLFDYIAALTAGGPLVPVEK
jgi:hypothetical protein